LFAGTLQSPEVSFRSDLDSLIESTLRNAISNKVTALTHDLQNQISGEIGPEIASARERMGALNKLQDELQRSLQQLSSIK
jgi:hypothetical protein